MDAREAALLIRVWAQDNHIFKTEFPVEWNPDENEREELSTSVRIFSQSENIFRAKGITAVAYNNANNEVIVFTEKTVPQKDIRLLPQFLLQPKSASAIKSPLLVKSTISILFTIISVFVSVKIKFSLYLLC